MSRIWIISLLLAVTLPGIAHCHKVDCQLHYEELDATKCAEKGCIWKDVAGRQAEEPRCFFDFNQVGYKFGNVSILNKKLLTSSDFKSANQQSFELGLVESTKKLSKSIKFFPKVVFKYITMGERILRFKIQEQDKSTRENQFYFFEDKNLIPDSSDNFNPAYSLEFSQNHDKFGFKIVRKDDGDVAWDCIDFGGGLLFSEQLLQITTKFSTPYVYGMGENTHRQYRHILNYKTWPIFNFDQPPDDLERNSYGTHPFMMFVNQTTGKATGIFFMNTNAMEYSLTPDRYLTYKTSGGILDFFVIIGDSPEHVVQLYQTRIIPRPILPPFWGLGFQISRYGYKNTSEVREVIERNRRENIPHDVQYVDIDYMNSFNDFTYDRDNFGDLPALINETKHEMGLRWTFIVDIAILGNDSSYHAFQDGYDRNVFVRWDSKVPNSQRGNPDNAPLDRDVFYGRVWPRGPAAFPDFLAKNTTDWWSENLEKFYKLLPFDGIWIDMNEPANFDNRVEVCPSKNCYMSTCPNNKWDFPDIRLKAVWVQNRTENRLSYRTLCMSTVQEYSGKTVSHYDAHNLYSYSELIQTIQALRRLNITRPFVLTRSTFAGSGQYTAHWTGDNTSSWDHLRRSLLQMFEFNLFGIPWVGADICGFQHNTTPELCQRWHQLGAFYSFARNHNDIPSSVDQDPAAWIGYNHPEVTDAARASLRFRYRFLMYLYTLHAGAAMNGSTVFKPLFHEFPLDVQAYEHDEQFLWGPSVLVAPFLYQGQETLDVYLPVETDWFPYHERINVTQDPIHGNITLKAADYAQLPPIYFRAGSIVPEACINATTPIHNTAQIRKTLISLNVFLDRNSTARGSLYWDNDQSTGDLHSIFEFVFENKRLTITRTGSAGNVFDESLAIEQIHFHALKNYSLLPFMRVLRGAKETVLPFTPVEIVSGSNMIYSNISAHVQLSALDTHDDKFVFELYQH